MMEVARPNTRSIVSKTNTKSVTSSIPEIIEEFQKDADGKVTVAKYIKGKLLGKGGFAYCYQAKLLPSQSQYALKIVSKETLTKLKAKQKLQSEISIHKRLRHENVVKFERYFEDVDNVYILLELCSNNSMTELLKRRRKIAEVEVRCYISQLIHSLQYLHSQLIIHRDLKLGNLFLDSELRVKVGDFGLAARLSHVQERRRTLCGTPNYIAPEILQGKDGHSFEVDVWSAGVVMYTLLLGTPPFESTNVKETYNRILCNQYHFPEHISISDDAKSLIRLLLQPRPENRPCLETILSHSFFTHPNNTVPTKLPECALFNTPQRSDFLKLSNNISMDVVTQANTIANTGYNTTTTTTTGTTCTTNPIKTNAVERQLVFGDENDPHAMNRMTTNTYDVTYSNHTHNNNQVHMKGSIKDPFSALLKATSTSSGIPIIGATQAKEDPINIEKKALDTVTWDSNMGLRRSKDYTSNAANVDTIPKLKLTQDTRTTRSQVQTTLNKAKDNILRSSQDGLFTSRSTTTAVMSSSSRSTSRARNADKIDIYTDTATHINKNDTSATKVKPYSSTSVTATHGRNTLKSPSRMKSPMTRSSSTTTTTMNHHTTTATTSTARGSNDIRNGSTTTTNTFSTGITTQPSTSSYETTNIRKRACTGLGNLEQDLEQINLHSHEKQTQSRSISRTRKEPLSAKKQNDKTPVIRSKVAKHDTHEHHTYTRTGTLTHTLTTPNKGYQPDVSHTESLRSQKSVKRKTAEESTDSILSVGHTTEPSQQRRTITTRSSHSNVTTTPRDNHTAGSTCIPRKQYLKTPGTLEAMHEMLNINYPDIIDDSMLSHEKGIQNGGTLHHTPISPNTLQKLIAPIWVVRYVDFTSKYGLGFIFNTGSAGVYFNDSTKIILSANGEIFQYIERKRSNIGGYEQTVQTHALTAYPLELQKKVTLLCHFKNYLLEQIKNDPHTNNATSTTNTHNNKDMDEHMMKMKMPIDINTVNAATSSIKFGHSSTVYIPTVHDTLKIHESTTPLGMERSVPPADCMFPGMEMTYLKKWVRTKHATLFRLSNRTVQVVFFDCSEVLLSSDATVITYVNKLGERSDLTLQSVISQGRKDVAKRLKYTKDIMHRLITIQQPTNTTDNPTCTMK